MAVLFAIIAALVAVYFLQREIQWLRQELEKSRKAVSAVATPAPTGSNQPRWLPGGSSEPANLPVYLNPGNGNFAPLHSSPAQNIMASPPPSSEHDAVTPVNTPVAIAAVPSNHLSGRVTDEGGNPVASATVEVILAGQAEAASPPSTRTGTNGLFSFTGLGAEKARLLRVRADGFATVELPDIPLPLDEFEITLNRLIGLDIRVVRQGANGQTEPVQGLHTLIILRATEGGYITASTDVVNLVNGQWRTGQLEPGTYRVGVATATGEYAESAPQPLTSLKGGQVVVTLGLRQTLTGTLASDPDRTPIANGKISLQMMFRPAAAGPAPVITATTNHEGKFTLEDVPPGTYRVTLSADLHTTKVLESIPVVAGPPPAPAEFFLRKTTPGIMVTVRNAGGELVVGAPVTVAPIGSAPGSSKSWFGQTGVDGTYTIESVPPGRYAISAGLPGSRGRQRMREATVEGAGLHALEIRFLNQIEVKGRILRDGKPYHGSLSLRARDSVVADGVLRTDEKGLFSALVEPGEWLLVPADGSGVATLTVTEGRDIPVELNLE